MSPPVCVTTCVHARTSGGCGATRGEEHYQTADYRLEQILFSSVHIGGRTAFHFIVFEEDIVKNIRELPLAKNETNFFCV